MRIGRAGKDVVRWSRRVLPALAAIPLVTAACGYDWTVVRPEESPADDAGGTGQAETCKLDGECPEASFCAFLDGECGAGASGKCTPRTPAAKCAGAAGGEVCTCDGVLVANACEASSRGSSVGPSSRCAAAPAKTFRCGKIDCSAQSFCVATTDKVGTITYRCEPFVCAERTCACKEAAAACAGATCAALDEGGIIVQCK